MKSLNFTIQTQLQSNWCWAAVATSVALFYDVGSSWTQCGLASKELSKPDCCNDGAACNQDWYLDRALTRTGNLQAFSSGSAAFAAVTHEIDGEHPLGLRIGWTDGSGHFVVISGYDDTNAPDQFVTVRDPFWGTSTIRYADFVSSYQGTGRCTHSYTTRASVATT